MIKQVLVCIWVWVAVSSGAPSRTFEVLDDVANEAEVIEAAEPLRGSSNLNEKRMPVIRLAIPTGYLGLAGTKNLGERAQVPYHYEPPGLPGLHNLDEKAIPDAVIARINLLSGLRSPKSHRLEKVAHT